MRVLALSMVTLAGSGCGLFHSLERDTGGLDIIDTATVVDTSDTDVVDTGDTVDTSETVDTEDGPDDIFPTSGDYKFITNENFSDDCLFWNDSHSPGEEAFTGNATVNPNGVTWIMDEDTLIETQWVADNSFYGAFEEGGQVTEDPVLDAKMIMDAAWLGEWSSDLELVAAVEVSMRCEGRDCATAEADYLQQTGVVLPCVTTSGVDGTFSR